VQRADAEPDDAEHHAHGVERLDGIDAAIGEAAAGEAE
jgi:hypothetical protein